MSLIEGELTFWVGGRIIKAPTGSFIYGPRDIPHTFTVTSPQARRLVVTEPAGFERFMRALGEPAAALTIPPTSVPLPSRDKIMAAAAEFGLEILGPAGIPSYRQSVICVVAKLYGPQIGGMFLSLPEVVVVVKEEEEKEEEEEEEKVVVVRRRRCLLLLLLTTPRQVNRQSVV